MADADLDGDSDGADFLVWQQQHTGDLSPLSNAMTVPEPVTGILLLEIAAFGLWGRLRRHC